MKYIILFVLLTILLSTIGIYYLKLNPDDVLRMTTIALVVACFTIDARYGLVAIFVAIMLGYAFSSDRRNQEALDNSIADSIKTIDATISEKNRSETAVETIPNTIVQIWVQKDPANPAKIPIKEQNYSAQIRNMNPDFNYLFFDETDVEPFFTKHYPEYYPTYQRLPLFIQKMDFFRYLIMYHYGGFYFDMDVWALAPLDDKIRNHSAVFPVDEYIVGRMSQVRRFSKFSEKDQSFLLGQYAFGCVAHHPFLKRVIDQIHSNIDVYIKTVNNTEIYVYQSTGPDFVTEVYTEYENPNSMFILANGKRQMFGNYARHDYSGNWKPQWKIH